VSGIVLWAIEGSARDLLAAARAKLPGLLARAGSQVTPLVSSAHADAAADAKRFRGSIMGADDAQPEDAAHAAALAGCDLSRSARVADGGCYSPTPRAPRVSDGEFYTPGPSPCSHAV
jgi:hypothetical protein